MQGKDKEMFNLTIITVFANGLQSIFMVSILLILRDNLDKVIKMRLLGTPIFMLV